MIALVMEIVISDVSISVLFLMLSNDTGQSVSIRWGPDEEARRGIEGVGQSKINRAKQTWRGVSSVATRYTHRHTLKNHTRTYFLPEWQVAKLEEAKERKKMTVLRMEALNEACCWPALTTKQKHLALPLNWGVKVSPLGVAPDSLLSPSHLLFYLSLVKFQQLFLMKSKLKSFPGAAVS